MAKTAKKGKRGQMKLCQRQMKDPTGNIFR